MSDATPSIFMSQEELEALNRTGRFLIQDIAGLICETVWWASYGACFVLAVHVLVRQGLRSLTPVVLFVTTILFFASSTTQWALHITLLIKRYQVQFLNDPTLSLQQRLDLSQVDFSHVEIPMKALLLLNTLAGSCLLIWRASVLWTNRLVLIPSCICFAGSLAFSVITLSCSMSEQFGVKIAMPSDSRTCTWSESIAWAFALVAALGSTSLIVFKSWNHRRLLRHSYADVPARTQLWGGLLLLLESGPLYCIFLIFLVTEHINIPRVSGAFYVYVIISTTGTQLSGLLPTLIIVFSTMREQEVHRSAHISFEAGGSTTTIPSLHRTATPQSPGGSIKTFRDKEISHPIPIAGYSIASSQRDTVSSIIMGRLESLSPRNWSFSHLN